MLQLKKWWQIYICIACLIYRNTCNTIYLYSIWSELNLCNILHKSFRVYMNLYHTLKVIWNTTATKIMMTYLYLYCMCDLPKKTYAIPSILHSIWSKLNHVISLINPFVFVWIFIIPSLHFTWRKASRGHQTIYLSPRCYI